MKRIFITMLVLAAMVLAGCSEVNRDAVVDLASKAKELSAQVDTGQEVVEDAAEAIITAPAAGTQFDNKTIADIVDLLEIARVAAPATAPINPYAGPIAIGASALITILSAVFGVKKSADAATAEKKYSAHKAGTERFMKAASGDEELKLYDMIGNARRAAAVS